MSPQNLQVVVKSAVAAGASFASMQFFTIKGAVCVDVNHSVTSQSNKTSNVKIQRPC